MTQSGEITAATNGKRASRVPGEVNTANDWQVRIRWSSGPGMTWPEFTYDAKATEADALDCARRAMTWPKANDGLNVTEAWVRGPGASEWALVVPTTRLGADLTGVDT